MADKPEKPARRRPGRIPVACAECRRLKLKCDRKKPCETCVKRGCPSICPDGTLTQKANRLVLANTGDLHDYIGTLISRIRQLEEGLSAIQRDHGLLTDDLLRIKYSGPALPPTEHAAEPSSASGLESRKPTPESLSPDPNDTMNEDETDFVDSFGTLHIGANGSSQYLGTTARPDHILALSSPKHSRRHLPRLSTYILQASSMGNDYFPIEDFVEQSIYDRLPPLHEAYSLCEIYLEYSSILWDGISRARLFDGIVIPIYNADSYAAMESPQDLALLYMVFALACLFDLSRTPNSVEGEEYYVLSRAACNCGNVPFFSTRTLTSIEITMHAGYYLEYSGTPNRAWMLYCQSVIMGLSVGLHRSPTRWRLDDALADRRRRLFWNLYIQDFMMAQTFGRPPIFNLATSDVEFPHDAEETVNAHGVYEVGLRQWSFSFLQAVEQQHPSHVAGGKRLAYAEILEIDRQVRDFSVPEKFNFANTIEADVPRKLKLQGWYGLIIKANGLFRIHRAYLVAALSRSSLSSPNPGSATHEHPFQTSIDGKFGPSVVASYRSAHTVIKGLKLAARSLAEALFRPEMAQFGTIPALSSAIVMAFIVTAAPGTNLAIEALADLEELHGLLQEVTTRHPLNSSYLAVVERLLSKSKACLEWYRLYGHSDAQPQPTDWIENLDQLTGQTHLVVDSRRPVETDISFKPAIDSRRASLSLDVLHPSLVRDLPMLNLSPIQGHAQPIPQPMPYHSEQYPLYPQQQQQQQWHSTPELPFRMSQSQVFAEPGSSSSWQASNLPYPAVGDVIPASTSDAYGVFGGAPGPQFQGTIAGHSEAAASTQMYTGVFSNDEGQMRVVGMLDPTWQAYMQQLGF